MGTPQEKPAAGKPSLRQVVTLFIALASLGMAFCFQWFFRDASDLLTVALIVIGGVALLRLPAIQTR